MNLLSHRLYAGEDDLRFMLDFLVATRPAERVADFPSLVDLRELLALPLVQANTRLWFDVAGRLSGYAFVDHYNNLRFEYDPASAPPGVEEEMVAWGEACLRRAMQASGEVLALDASCRAEDAVQVERLQRHGFALQEIRSLHMLRRLDQPIPAPQLPDGFRIRHVSGEAEAQALVTLHRAAFDSQEMTVEERLAMMRDPDYDLELDLLVVAPDGRLAAYCMCSISREENERTGRKQGYTDPLATHPDFQRRGLARALLLTGLLELKRRGMQEAALGTSSENIPMQRAAQAAGFRVASTTLWFSKPVS